MMFDPSVRRLERPVAGRTIPGCGAVVRGFESKGSKGQVLPTPGMVLGENE